jgi:hypothetical protein
MALTLTINSDGSIQFVSDNGLTYRVSHGNRWFRLEEVDTGREWTKGSDLAWRQSA